MFNGARILKKYYSLPLRNTFRTFLSDNYKCTTEWDARLLAPYMQKVKLDNLYYDIDQSFQQKGVASPIDIDIFVNKITKSDDRHTEEIQEVLHRLRLTEETTNTLDSTGHAVIRNFLEMGHTDELLQILDDRLNYGVFLDHYIASYALDLFLKKGDYFSAARIATFLMLQEDFDNEISKMLSLYACIKYLATDMKPFYPPKEEKEDDESKEVIKVRVKFLRNEFFDDHFDLKDHQHLIGKTLAMIGGTIDSDIGKNSKLLGLVLYQKYDEAVKVAKSMKCFFKDVIVKCKDNLSDKDDNDKINQLKILLNEASNINESNFENEIKNLLKDVIDKNESQEIENQKRIYLEWNQIRDKKLLEELERLLRAKRLKEVEKLREEMKKEEEKLWFFENEDKIDLQIDSKTVYYPKRWFGKKKKPRVVDEDYVPPEILKKRNN